MNARFAVTGTTLLLALALTPSELHAWPWSKKCDLSDAASLTIKSFDRCSQNHLDSFYLELRAGSAIPDGSFDGRVQLARPDSSGKRSILRFLRRLIPNFIRESEEYFMERLWKGKIFYRENLNEAVLRNRVRSRLAFPAHVYYGRSLFDDSRLSVIIDYKYNQDIEGYNPSTDWMVNEEGLAVRDEIRQVRPGLYLGRAYVKDKFLLNFILQSSEQ
jgi:hypothetical protein